MNFRKAGGRFEPRIELTPLIDVLFQLLIFFLLTTTFVEERFLSVELPVADASAATRELRILVLSVDADGTVFHQREPLGETALDALLAETARERAPGVEPTILLRGDAQATHGSVVELMDRARRHGLSSFAIASRPTEEVGP